MVTVTDPPNDSRTPPTTGTSTRPVGRTTAVGLGALGLLLAASIFLMVRSGSREIAKVGLCNAAPRRRVAPGNCHKVLGTRGLQEGTHEGPDLRSRVSDGRHSSCARHDTLEDRGHDPFARLRCREFLADSRDGFAQLVRVIQLRAMVTNGPGEVVEKLADLVELSTAATLGDVASTSPAADCGSVADRPADVDRISLHYLSRDFSRLSVAP